MTESIKTFGLFAYIKLFDDRGDIIIDKRVSVGDNEYKKIFWRFYVRKI